jgi:hypothetical protein
LRKPPPKGYGALTVVRSKTDGAEKKMEGERDEPTGEDDWRGGPPLLAARKLAGAIENGTRGHGLARESDGKEEEIKGVLTEVNTETETDRRQLASKNGGR